MQFGIDDILSILPHRPPFLFVDGVIKLIPEKEILAERQIKEDEPFFTGHFPNKPIMPGVLVIDALAQTSGLLWGLSKKVAKVSLPKNPKIFFLAAANIKFLNPSFPKDKLMLFSKNLTSFGNLFSYSVEAYVEKRTIAKGTLSLAMIEEKL
jgi:3-hydroxymyristoyl/3-hydroxydecanoyl-(acyl carrier protein) dehydratase